MTLSSIVILVLIVAASALAVWRNLRKGAPCECGGTCCGCKKNGKSC